GIGEESRKILDTIQKDLFEKAKAFMADNTKKISSYDDFKEFYKSGGGFAESHWCGSPECEQEVQEETKATIRVIPFEQPGEKGSCIKCGKELEGIHNRTDFDLQRHIEHSGKKLDYFDEKNNERFVPYVIETSAGVDRTTLTCLIDAYEEEEVKGEKRVVLKFSPKIAPIKVGIFPLVNKDGLPEIAEKIAEDISKNFAIFYDSKGAIGRRYRRMDEAGTPFGITVDHQTLEDGSVTLRDRDSMIQERIAAEQANSVLSEKFKS
ncbi:hypothetical protein E3V33_06030, partial [Candidatus Marinimicrobia bacterium MT.SAG.4]